MRFSHEQLSLLSRLLSEAEQVPEAEREAWVDRVSESEPLFRPALLSALGATETGGDDTLIGQLARVAGSAGMGGTVPWEQVRAEGDGVGLYTLLRPIGAGGMGEVWLARRSDGLLKRPVALKLPHRWLASPQFLERFSREREILSSLSHPHIARLYDAGITADAQPFLALEYVEGRPLTEACDAAGLGVRRRLEVFLQVLDAVRYAHAHLVIHRDLKPSNILLSEDGQVHLLDFGVAKLLDDRTGVELTQTHQAPALTPLYASPEQVSGGAVTTASDLYSLGVLLYELLAGVHPYRLRERSRGAVEEAVLEAEAERPSAACTPDHAARCGMTRKRLSAALRGDLDTIVLKALQKAPADRYATADAFADDLRRHLAGDVVLARPESAWYRLGKLVRRRRLETAALALVAASLSAGLGLALWQAHEARAQARAAQAAEQFMHDVFVASEVYGGDSVKARNATARELLDSGARRIEHSLGDAPEVKLKLLKTLGQMYHALDLIDDRQRLARLRVKLARETFRGPHPVLVDALLDLQQALDQSASASTEVRQVLDEAVAMLDSLRDTRSLLRGRAELQLGEHLGLDAGALHIASAVRILVPHGATPELIAAHYQSGMMHSKAGRLREAHDAYAAAVRVAHEVGPRAGASLVAVHTGLATVQITLGDVAGAEQSCLSALAIESGVRSEHSFGSFDAVTCLADVRVRSSRAGQAVAEMEKLKPFMLHFAERDGVSWPLAAAVWTYAEALVHHGRGEEALEMLSVPERYANAPELHPSVEAWRSEIRAAAYTELGRYADAADALAVAQRMRRDTGRIGTPIYNYHLAVQAKLLLAQGRPQEAAAAIAEFTLGAETSPVSSDVLERDALLAETALASGRDVEAGRLAAALRARIERSESPMHGAAWLRRAAVVEGRVHLQAGRAKEAAAHFTQALLLGRKVLHEHSLALADTMVWQAHALGDLGRRQEALALRAAAQALHARHRMVAPHHPLPSGKTEGVGDKRRQPLAFLAPRPGLEPGTYGLTVRRSTD